MRDISEKRLCAETNIVTVEEVIQQAIRLEREAELLYARWQSAFASYPPITLLWQEYAEEEAQHACLLEDIRARLPVEQRRRSANKEMVDAVQRAQAALSRHSLRPATVGEALVIASEIENSEINAVLELLVRRFAPERAQAMIHASLREHIAKMEESMRSLEHTILGLEAVW